MGTKKTDLAVLSEVQRDSLKKVLDQYNRWGLKYTAIGIALIGLALLAVWLISNNATVTSMLMLLTGVSLLILALMLFFLSPSRYLRSEVCDAIAIAGTENLRKIFASMLITSRGIYLPADEEGPARVFIPLSRPDEKTAAAAMRDSRSIFSVSGERLNGLVLEPPGYGLYMYSQKIGAIFTHKDLDFEIKDIFENGLELASRVRVDVSDTEARITLKGLANAGLCAAIRSEGPEICEQIGCPICSSIACMIADGTGAKTRIRSIQASGKTIVIALELFED